MLPDSKNLHKSKTATANQESNPQRPDTPSQRTCSAAHSALRTRFCILGKLGLHVFLERADDIAGGTVLAHDVPARCIALAIRFAGVAFFARAADLGRRFPDELGEVACAWAKVSAAEVVFFPFFAPGYHARRSIFISSSEILTIRTAAMPKLALPTPLPRIIGQRVVPHEPRRIVLFAICIGDIENRVPERSVLCVFDRGLADLLCARGRAEAEDGQAK